MLLLKRSRFRWLIMGRRAREFFSLAFLKSLMDNYIYACTKDVELIKPGNVRKGSPHKDTTAEDYITSAISSSSTLCSNELTLGDRTYLSVSHTRAKINVNTNLGIILLCCPIIHSIINYNQLELCDAIKSSLEDSSSNDTR